MPSGNSVVRGRRRETQLQLARRGVTSLEMSRAAASEGLSEAVVRDEVARGRMVIPANVHRRRLDPTAIGLRARVKVNVSIGSSPTTSSPWEEVVKAELAVHSGADTITDLSTGCDAPATREELVDVSPVPVGTVPVYEAVERVGAPEHLTVPVLLETIERQALQGVDYMTIHAGVLLEHLPLCAHRVSGIVSRGGGLLARWMVHHRRQNPLFEHFDDVLRICRESDVTVSLGGGLRPGCLADSSDAAQLAELATLGELTRRARALDVQVMVEGPGHVPIDQVEMNVRRQQTVCDEAPLYTLGPLVTDVAPGHDHIASAMGAAFAAWHGASLLCYVTPKEHLGPPGPEDVRQGLIAYRIAAHAADVARGCTRAATRELELAKARSARDWERQFSLAVDPAGARALRDESLAHDRARSERSCSMCGPRFCPVHNFSGVDWEALLRV